MAVAVPDTNREGSSLDLILSILWLRMIERISIPLCWLSDPSSQTDVTQLYVVVVQII